MLQIIHSRPNNIKINQYERFLHITIQRHDMYRLRASTIQTHVDVTESVFCVRVARLPLVTADWTTDQAMANHVVRILIEAESTQTISCALFDLSEIAKHHLSLNEIYPFRCMH